MGQDEASGAGKQLCGVVLGSEMNMSPGSLLGCMNGGIAHRLKEGIVPLSLVLVRPHLDTASIFGPQHSKHLDKLEGAWGGPPW